MVIGDIDKTIPFISVKSASPPDSNETLDRRSSEAINIHVKAVTRVLAQLKMSKEIKK